MDISQITGSASQSSGVQGMGGGHHHHKSISDQVSQMGSAIDQALSAGTMTSDQAASLKSELADITKIMSQSAQTTSTTGQTSQAGSISQLSDSDRQKVFSELQDVRKQLHAAMASQNGSTSPVSSSDNNAVSNLFSQIDANGNGSVDQSEFTNFLAQIGANALSGYTQNGTASASYSALSMSSFQVTA